MAQLHVKSRTTATAPGSPSEGDAYIVPAAASGFTGASEGDLAIYSNGWGRQTPPASPGAWYAYVEDEDIRVRSDGSTWFEDPLGNVDAALTASTTQTQGQGALTKTVSVVTTCANANDVCTLPVPRAVRLCVVANRGAQTLQLFPSSGVSIDAGSANASTTIAAGKVKIFLGVSSTNWTSLLGA